MPTIKIEFSIFHLIDINRGKSESTSVEAKATIAVDDYINGIIPFIEKRKNNKEFRFASNTTEVSGLIANFVDSKEKEVANRIAQRLAKIEKETDTRYGHLHETRRSQGGLVQAVFSKGDERFYLAAKVDSQSFLDPTDYQRHDGLPFERYVLKSCLVPLDEKSTVLSAIISVFDTNAVISKYWWQLFLELEEINTDVYNTETAFKQFENMLKVNLTRKYKADYTYLRNRLVSYFRTNDAYVHIDMIQTVFRGYSPVSPDFDLDRIIKLAETLPREKNFDQQFNIQKERIKARMRHKIALGNSMELNLLADVKDMRHVVFSHKDENGQKFISIKSDTGYDFFETK